MASFARRWSLAAAWSVDDASTFAAQKEFKLLQLLSNDKKALVTARRLGLFCHNDRNRRARLPLLIPVRASPARRMLMRHRRLRDRLGSRRKAQRAARGVTLRDELGKGGTAVPPLCSAW